MNIPLKNKRSLAQIGLIALGVLIIASTSITLYLLNQRAAKAAFVPESCFVMDIDDPGRIQSYNVSDDPDCLSDVTIPSTIAGNTVTTIGAGIFYDDTITSLSLPSTITSIESGSLAAVDIALNNLIINVDGDLTIGSGAFGTGITGNVSIITAGNLIYHESATGTLTSLHLEASGEITVPSGTTGNETIASLSISAADNVTVGAGAFSGRVIGTATIHSDKDISIESGAFTSNIDNFTASADQALSITASMYVSFGSISIKSIDLTAGTTLSVGSSSLSGLVDTTHFSLTAGTGLMHIYNSAICNNDLTTLDISAPAGLTVAGGALCDLTQLSNINFLELGGDVSITGLTNAALTDFTIETDGSFTATNSALSGNMTLETISITAGGDITITNGAFPGDNTTLSQVTLSGDTVTIENGAFSSLASPTLALDITASNDVLFTGGAFAGVTALTTITVDAAGDITVDNSALSGASGIQSVDFAADNDIIVLSGGSGFLNSYSSTTNVSLVAGRDINFGYTNNSTLYNLPLLTNLTLSATRDVILGYQMITNLPLLDAFTLEVGRDFSVNSASLATLPSLTALNISADRNITIGSGVAGDNAQLEEVTLSAGGALNVGAGILSNPTVSMDSLEKFELTAGSDLTIQSGGMLGLFRRVVLTANGDIIIGSTFNSMLTESVTINATGDVSFNDGSFSNLHNLTQLSITSGNLVSFGNGIFSASNLSSATINSPSTSINNPGIPFLYAGATYNKATLAYENTDQIRYVAIYINNPGSLTSTASADNGGFLINPAQLKMQYKNGANSTIATETTVLGEQTNGDPILSYLVSENPSNDMSLYFHEGDSYTVTPPAITGYQTPAARTITFDANANVVAFTYLANATTDNKPPVEAPNTGIRTEGVAVATHANTPAASLYTLLVIGAFGVLFVIAGALIAYRAKS